MTSSVLIFSDGSETIGDGIIKLPFASAIKRALPNAQVTWLSAGRNNVYEGALKELASGCIDEIMYLPMEKMSFGDISAPRLFDGIHAQGHFLCSGDGTGRGYRRERCST